MRLNNEQAPKAKCQESFMDETTVHLFAGGLGGTVGAVVTCPLEVVKVRLQSSAVTLAGGVSSATAVPQTGGAFHPASPSATAAAAVMRSRSMSIVECVRSIARTEGLTALFKGLGPTLVGILPARCIYFSAYHTGQTYFSRYFEPNSSAVFLFSAAMGGFITSTLTNPIFYIKTKLQLDQSAGKAIANVPRVIRETWASKGLRGFYKGVTASYVGISETALNFVIYERVKADLLAWRHSQSKVNTADGSAGRSINRIQTPGDMGLCMLASIFAKSIATLLAYPHEVVRTRLRENPDKYRRFLQTLLRVHREEGARALYGGLATHYLRQVPNTCIMMGTYEIILYVYRYWNPAVADWDDDPGADMSD